MEMFIFSTTIYVYDAILI